jgi:lipoprotein-releasing system permease protein
MVQGRRVQGAMIRGILPGMEPAVSDIATKMKKGTLADLRPGEYNIVLGKELATWLGVAVGDKVTVFVPELNTTPVGVLPKMRRFTVSGIFEAGAQEYDLGLALVHMGDAQKLTRMGEGVTGVRLKLDDLWNAWPIARDLADKLAREQHGGYYVRDWTRDHENFFRALKMEKTVMFVLLSLMIGVAAVGLVSSLVMLVQDKQSDIAILRTQGLTQGGVMRVFIVQGVVIGMVGIALGVLFGVLLSLNLSYIVHAIESLTGAELMPSDVYYISGVPTQVQASDVATIALVAFGLCLVATLYPAWRASRTDPAAALRYE